MKALAAVSLAGALLFLLAAGCGEESDTAGDQTTTESPTTTESEPPASPQQSVRDALGDEVAAGGYAGDVQINDVSFEGAEVLVTGRPPRGASRGPAAAI